MRYLRGELTLVFMVIGCLWIQVWLLQAGKRPTEIVGDTVAKLLIQGGTR